MKTEIRNYKYLTFLSMLYITLMVTAKSTTPAKPKSLRA